MRESRLFRIVYELLQNGRATAPELAQKLEVSVRTIYRDIDALSAAGIPVYAAQGKGGGIALQGGYTLEKALLSQQEQQQLLAALQGMAAAGQSDALLAKIGGLFRTKSPNWVEVDFSDWARRSPRQDTFDTIKEAILQRRVLSFDYWGGSGTRETRTVQPVRLVFKSQSWYLYAFCLLREDHRFFKLSRIRTPALLPETFAHDFSGVTIEKQLPAEDTVAVTLKFEPKAAFRVYDEFAGEITEDAQGNLYVQADLPNNERLFSYVLSFGDAAEIVAPPSVREQMQKRLQRMQEKYKNGGRSTLLC